MLGYELNKITNSIITLIAYVVYKKFQKEKEYTVRQYDNINVYLKSEIKYRNHIYDRCPPKHVHESVKGTLDLLEHHL